MTITLRKITLDDSKKIVKWRNNPLVRANLFSQEELTIEKHICYYHKYIEKGLVHQFIINVDGFDCGTCFLKNIDLMSKTAEFGIFIGEDSYRGLGIGRIATQKAVEFGFDELSLSSIYLLVFKKNISAIKSYCNVGFQTIETDNKNTSCHDIVTMRISKETLKR